MDRDISILQHILMYCDQIGKSIERFGDSCEIFENDVDYHNSICMDMLQIGELVGRLSDNFIKKNQQKIPWKQIRSLRNMCAHDYLNVTYSIIFEIAHTGVIELKEFCEAQIAKNEDNNEAAH